MKNRILAALLIAAGLTVSGGLPAHAQDMSASDQAELAKAPALGEKIIGKDDASVTIVEYASLTCSHCADFHEKVLPVLKTKYIDKGQAKLYFRGFTLNPLDTAAQMLTHCTDKEKYFPLLSAFFTTQKSWATSSDPVDALLQVSKQAGYTKESFEACLRNQKLLDEINAVRDKAEKVFKVSATPTLFVNGKRVAGAPTVESLSKMIDAELKK